MIQPWHRRSQRERVGILALTLAAISGAIIGWVSYAAPVLLPMTLSKRDQAYVCCSDGLLRVYHYQCNEPIEMEISDDRRRINLRLQSDRSICQRIQHAPPNRISQYAIISTVLRPVHPGGGTVVLLNGVRTSVAAPVSLLLAYPIFVVLKDAFRRRQQVPGLCVHCHYDLTGNTTGICPECGKTRVCWSCGVRLGPSPGTHCPECGASAERET